MIEAEWLHCSPALNRLIAVCELNPLDVIVVFEISRVPDEGARDFFFPLIHNLFC